MAWLNQFLVYFTQNQFCQIDFCFFFLFWNIKMILHDWYDDLFISLISYSYMVFIVINNRWNEYFDALLFRFSITLCLNGNWDNGRGVCVQSKWYGCEININSRIFLSSWMEYGEISWYLIYSKLRAIPAESLDHTREEIYWTGFVRTKMVKNVYWLINLNFTSNGIFWNRIFSFTISSSMSLIC